MARRFRTSSHAKNEFTDGKHRFEHWYRDNTVYFITAKTRDGFHAFESEEAKAIFWDRFTCWTTYFGFFPWVTTLLVNHYHPVGYLKVGENLGTMMQRIHGSVANLVNDTLPQRHLPFWRDRASEVKDYYDGCLRSELQGRHAYKYTLMQAVYAKLVTDWRDYPHTRVTVELEMGVARAQQLNAFMTHVRYPRYE
jgi:hypothetical protein